MFAFVNFVQIFSYYTKVNMIYIIVFTDDYNEYHAPYSENRKIMDTNRKSGCKLGLESIVCTRLFYHPNSETFLMIIFTQYNSQEIQVRG